MSPDDEMVLVIARGAVPGGLGWRGVRATPLESYLEAIGQQGSFRRRAEVEDDPSWKQVIPYLALFDGSRLFLLKRTRLGGDSRLHERHSIGIGGHVNPADGGPLGGLLREWQEELSADFVPDLHPLGVLNDDQDPVGAVHLGLVFSADASGRPVAIRETDKLSGRFVEFEAVAAVASTLETWSSLLFEFLSARRGMPVP